MAREKKPYRYTGYIEHAYDKESGPWEPEDFIKEWTTSAVSERVAENYIVYRWIKKYGIPRSLRGNYRLAGAPVLDIDIITETLTSLEPSNQEETQSKEEEKSVPYQMAFDLFQDEERQ